MTKPKLKCGCKGGSFGQFRLCPMHATAPELLTNLQGLLAWIDHAKKQERSRAHMPDESYLVSARTAVAKALNGK